jgi:hypothetical protein
MKASEWRAERNVRSRARLDKSLPTVFPAPVLVHALARPLIPPTPRLAIDSYWRAHPLRADRLARALAARSTAPEGWTWRLAAHAKDELPASFRTPPAPFREAAFSRGPGFCCVCGQPVYRFGWHVDLWDRGPNANARWHTACVTAWQFWTATRDQARLLKRAQRHRCTQSGARLWKTAEVDHRVPLFQVWRERAQHPWPAVLAFWGAGNLQVINRDMHVAKCAAEHAARARRVAPEPFAPSAE